jgi:hypothetical protein
VLRDGVARPALAARVQERRPPWLPRLAARGLVRGELFLEVIVDVDAAHSCWRLEVVLGERERFLTRSPARHKTMIIARTRQPWRSSAAWRKTATISSTVGGSAG